MSIVQFEKACTNRNRNTFTQRPAPVKTSRVSLKAVVVNTHTTSIPVCRLGFTCYGHTYVLAISYGLPAIQVCVYSAKCRTDRNVKLVKVPSIVLNRRKSSCELGEKQTCCWCLLLSLEIGYRTTAPAPFG